MHSLNPLGVYGSLTGIELVLCIFKENFVKTKHIDYEFLELHRPEPDLYLIPFDR